MKFEKLSKKEFLLNDEEMSLVKGAQMIYSGEGLFAAADGTVWRCDESIDEDTGKCAYLLLEKVE